MNSRWLLGGPLLAVALGICSCGPSGFGPTPGFKYVKQKEGGSADIYVFKGTADDLEVLWISAEKEKLKLPQKGSKTFDLAKSSDGLQVAIDIWEKAPRFSAYCNDITDDTKKRATWRAKSGKVTITILEPVDPAGAARPKRYKATVRLEHVLFEDSAGHQATLEKEEITEAVVGWYAG
jgi:hypothetical protein